MNCFMRREWIAQRHRMSETIKYYVQFLYSTCKRVWRFLFTLSDICWFIVGFEIYNPINCHISSWRIKLNVTTVKVLWLPFFHAESTGEKCSIETSIKYQCQSIDLYWHPIFARFMFAKIMNYAISDPLNKCSARQNCDCVAFYTRLRLVISYLWMWLLIHVHVHFKWFFIDLLFSLNALNID